MRWESEDEGLRAVPIAVRGGWMGRPLASPGRGTGSAPRAAAEHPELEAISQLVNGDAPAEWIVLPHPLLLPIVNLDPFLRFSLVLLLG